LPNRDLIVVGASAGGVSALESICASLPGSFEATVLVVLHTSSNSRGFLADVLNRAGPLTAVYPQDRDVIQKGRIYVAPPDFHMLVESGCLRLFQGPRENLHRPAIDPLFRSAANEYGSRTVGVILTGLLDDGSSGLISVKARNGVAVVQDPATALFPSMPKSALENVPDAYVATLEQIPPLLARLVNQPAGTAPQPDIAAEREVKYAELDMQQFDSEMPLGESSAYACPEFGGVLWETDQHGLLRFRCRVGHAYTARNLDAEQRIRIETALWAALRALEERASLYKRMASTARDRKQELNMRSFAERASDAHKHARILRDLLTKVSPSPEDQEQEEAA
jgi:two-component system, chemotaxis family, protein-glutamate methylesterase/glutaminase